MLDTGTSGRKDTGDEKEMRVRSSSSVLARMRRLPAAYQVIVVLLRPLIVDLLAASGMSSDDAKSLLPPI